MLVVETPLMAHLADINEFISKIQLIYNVIVIGDAISDFVFCCFFKLNSSKSAEHTNSKLDTFNQQTKVRVTPRLMMSSTRHIILNFLKIALFDRGMTFIAETKVSV